MECDWSVRGQYAPDDWSDRGQYVAVLVLCLAEGPPVALSDPLRRVDTDLSV